jgi:hypothetical protein
MNCELNTPTHPAWVPKFRLAEATVPLLRYPVR